MKNRFSGMKFSWPYILLFSVLAACGGGNDKNPEISKIQVNTSINRFDKAYFAIDSNQLYPGLVQVQTAFPYFINDFTANILGAGIIGDSNKILPVANQQFYRSYAPVYAQIKDKFNDLSSTEKELNTAFRYIKAYFPAYQVPKFVSYFGPFDAPGAAITENAIAIGLHLYAGADFPYYTSVEGQQLYPTYLSRRFSKEYIPVNCVRVVVEDLFPEKNANGPLVEQMIEKGKYWWLLKKLMPNTPDTLINGFKKGQYEWCKANEGIIWNLVLQNDQIYSTDPGTIRNFIGEAPTTQNFPSAAPGNIGQWIGQQIVDAYMEKNPQTSAGQIMQMKPRTILDGSKYKPR